ncbi:hypothetical protein RB2150_02549 [Rhodobacteraceae bacterium HTCC2150]|nr:hypothetical protein RB2150_02549 [Rhodobacteraceae bacterium HTCC2150]
MIKSDRPLVNMTVGVVEKQYVWFRVAKCGTRSTLALLREVSTKFEIEQDFGVTYDPSRYLDYYKFAFVRNPLDRIQSGWKDKIVNRAPGGGKYSESLFKRLMDFDFFIDWLLDQDPLTINIHFRRQTLLIPHDVDFVGRMGNFTNDINCILAELGVKGSYKIPHNNKAIETNSQLSLSSSTLKKIITYYEPDYSRFDYTGI